MADGEGDKVLRRDGKRGLNMFMLPSAIIRCRDAFEFAKTVQFVQEYIDSTFFEGCSLNNLMCRWYVETRGIDCKLCVRIQPDNVQSKAGWNTEDFYRETYPYLRQINIEDYDTYSCYADITVREHFFNGNVHKTVGELKEYEMEKKKKYFDYLDTLRESGATNMLGAVPYLQRAFPELRNNRKQAQTILQSWMQETERRATK